MQDSRVFKVFKMVFLSVFYLIIAFLLLFSIATLSRKKVDQIPNIFGKGFLAVNENATSMIGDNKDSFNPGDLIFVNVLTKKQQEKLDLEQLYKNNAVITFYDRSKNIFNTHRVVDYLVFQGKPVIVTQGDNESEVDPYYFEATDVIAIYSGKIKNFGGVIDFMQKPVGFGVVVLLPMILLLGWQGFKLIKNVYVVKEANLKESLTKQSDLDREKLKAELLKELKEELEEEKK